MPTYVYRREDGTTFEVQQRITEDALTHDPDTGQAVTRIPVRGAGFVLKGTGWYVTDFRDGGKGASAGAGTAAAADGTVKSDAPAPAPAPAASPAPASGGSSGSGSAGS